MSDVNSLVSPGDCENNAGFSQSCSREAEMSFSAGLFSRNTNVFTLFWAPRSAFDYALAARGAQLGFCSPTDVEPSVSPPPVGNNSIRMARSDTSHDGHHQDLFNHCCPECISGTTRRTGITVMVKYSLTHRSQRYIQHATGAQGKPERALMELCVLFHNIKRQKHLKTERLLSIQESYRCVSVKEFK